MKSLENIYKLTQQKLKSYVKKELKRKYNEVMVKDGYVYAKGNVPVLLVAHLDTVHAIPVKEIVYSDKGNKLTSPQGLGGDDRNGVYMILEIIKEINCHVLFVEDEEIGLIGATTFTETFKGDMDINYIIELDRRGFKDAVYYSLDNKDFELFITESSKGHFKTAQGTCSDISEIAPFLGVAAVNLSSGYYKEHTLETYTLLNEVNENIGHVKEIINTAVDKPFEYKEKRYDEDDWGYWGGYGRGYLDEYVVQFYDRGNVIAQNYCMAMSDTEAVGATVWNIPSVKGEDIIGVFLSGQEDRYDIVRTYIEGKEEIGSYERLAWS